MGKAYTQVMRRKAAKDPTLEAIETVSKERKKRFDTVAEMVAKSSIHTRNWKFNGADEHFPNEPRLRTVDKYFPYADGGPLLIDEIYDAHEARECERKAQVLKKLGYRYLVLNRTTTAFDAIAVAEGKC